MFVALSAAQTALQGTNVPESWMRLAARYMAQAVLEQFLVYGISDPELFREAFSYGFDGNSTLAKRGDELIITNMFWDGIDEREVVGWADIRAQHQSAVCAPFGCVFE